MKGAMASWEMSSSDGETALPQPGPQVLPPHPGVGKHFDAAVNHRDHAYAVAAAVFVDLATAHATPTPAPVPPVLAVLLHHTRSGCPADCDLPHWVDGPCLVCGEFYGQHFGSGCGHECPGRKGQRGAWPMVWRAPADCCSAGCEVDHEDAPCVRCAQSFRQHTGHACPEAEWCDIDERDDIPRPIIGSFPLRR